MGLVRSAPRLEIPFMLFFPQLARRFGNRAHSSCSGHGCVSRGRQVANVIFTDPSLLIGLSLVQGAGYGLLLIGGIAFVSREAPKGTAATAQGILNGVTFSMSSIIGSGLGGVLASWLTIRGLYAVSACLGAIAIVLIALAVLPATRRLPAGVSSGPPDLARPLDRTPKGPPRGMGERRKDRHAQCCPGWPTRPDSPAARGARRGFGPVRHPWAPPAR